MSAAGVVVVPHALLDSPEWATLSPRAVKLLLAISRRFDGRNNGVIPYSSKDAQALLRCGPEAARTTFLELHRAGFIVCGQDAGHETPPNSPRVWAVSLWPSRPPQHLPFVARQKEA